MLPKTDKQIIPLRWSLKRSKKWTLKRIERERKKDENTPATGVLLLSLIQCAFFFWFYSIRRLFFCFCWFTPQATVTVWEKEEKGEFTEQLPYLVLVDSFSFFSCVRFFFFLEKEKNHKSERNNADMNVEQQERKGKRGGMRIDEEG